MLKDAMFYEVLFTKAKSLGFKFLHTDKGLNVCYPSYDSNQLVEVYTDEQFASVVKDILHWGKF